MQWIGKYLYFIWVSIENVILQLSSNKGLAFNRDAFIILYTIKNLMKYSKQTRCEPMRYKVKLFSPNVSHLNFQKRKPGVTIQPVPQTLQTRMLLVQKTFPFENVFPHDWTSSRVPLRFQSFLHRALEKFFHSIPRWPINSSPLNSSHSIRRVQFGANQFVAYSFRRIHFVALLPYIFLLLPLASLS